MDDSGAKFKDKSPFCGRTGNNKILVIFLHFGKFSTLFAFSPQRPRSNQLYEDQVQVPTFPLSKQAQAASK